MWIDVHAIDWLKFAWREKIETAHTEIKKVRQPENEWENRFRSVLQYSFSSYSLSADEKSASRVHSTRELHHNNNNNLFHHSCSDMYIKNGIWSSSISTIFTHSTRGLHVLNSEWKLERHFWLNNKAWNRSECVFKKSSTNASTLPT
jgi:hypothetical protein